MKKILTGSRLKKTVSFFLIYYLGYAVVGVFFGLPFGFTITAIIHFLIVLVPSIIAVTGITAVLQERKVLSSDYNTGEICNETA